MRTPKLLRYINRLLPFVLCAAILLCCASCNGGEDTVGTTAQYTAAAQPETVKMGRGSLSLCFSSSDSLNPFEAETAGNQQLSSLLFEPLVRLDENLNPQLALADKITVDGRSVSITLKSVRFSDGERVTAEDVTYSIRLARAAANGLYSAQLANISSYNAASANELELVLKSPDRAVAATLDFPIIKQNSTNRKNADQKRLPPLGAGRYVYNDDSGVYTLTGNPNYYKNIPQNTIELVNMPDTEALQYGIRSGEVDIYYSGVSTGDLPSMSGSISMVKQTNFVYLGVNSTTGALRSKYLRQAVGAMINRSDICKKAYFTYAEPALGLFPDGYEAAAECEDIFQSTENSQKAIEHLAKQGYNSINESGYYENSSGSVVKLTLLYNRENDYQQNAAELLQKQLKSGGVELELDARSYSGYAAAVKSGSYQLYLGEVKLNYNLDFSSLFGSAFGRLAAAPTTAATTAATAAATEGGTTAATAAPTTVSPAYEYVDIAGVYADYMSGKLSAAELGVAFGDYLPFIPIGYRLGVVSCNKTVDPVATASVSDAYYNIELLSIK